MEHSSSSSSSNFPCYCSACGKPPRCSAENPATHLPLKRCARCRQAWYHDLECQKRHFTVHKKECRKLALQLKHSSNNDTATPPHAKVIVEARPNRGNCLVARERISKRERIAFIDEHGIETEGWQPLVPPALLESQRGSRCALCFACLGPNPCHFPENFAAKNGKIPYDMQFCSDVCLSNGRLLGFWEEQIAMRKIYEQRGPVRIFSTAILLFRIYWAISKGNGKATAAQVACLQCEVSNNNLQNVKTGDLSDKHSIAVMATTMAMLQVSQELGVTIPPKAEMENMVRRIKLNGFSVANGESIAMGIGLYATPSFMNHSCCPNTIATFAYGQQHRPPSLLLTAYEDILDGDEVLISYLDNSCPRHIRRERLESDYFFVCACDGCKDNARETAMSGVKCPHCRQQSISEPRPVNILPNLAPSPRTSLCPSCQSTDFASQLRYLDAFEQLDNNNTGVSVLEEHHQKLRQACTSDSWYVQESGDRLLHAILDKLGHATTESEQETFASKALMVLEGLLQAAPTWTSTSHEFRRAIHKFQAAKLRLFLEPDPSTAIQLLQESQRMLADFYPKNHELMQNLLHSLREATM